jgi:hypothetical protein
VGFSPVGIGGASERYPGSVTIIPKMAAISKPTTIIIP